MSRHRIVSVDEVRTRAEQQFQRYGYHATSIQTLVDCIGVGRGSIYDTFDSKRGLYVSALRRYVRSLEQRFRALHDQPSPRAAILSVFESWMKESRDGCFLVNTSVELAPHDGEIAQIVANSLQEIENVFVRLIGQGQASGEILPAVDPVLTARGLLALYITLCVLTRSGSDESSRRDFAGMAGAMLTDHNRRK
ncbi:MAG: TetR/AcrR family transcriptional regulator [Spirochaetaceae bacterium]|nr:TetR/AcrR family transcriptional regulator [Spirochaetaceae bacterium]